MFLPGDSQGGEAWWAAVYGVAQSQTQLKRLSSSSSSSYHLHYGSLKLQQQFLCLLLFHIIFKFSSVAQSCLTLCNPKNCSTPGLPVHHQLLESKLMSIELVMPSNHLILCHPLHLPPSILPSIKVFSDESLLPIR